MFDILHRVGIRAPMTKVYEAIATPQGVAGQPSPSDVRISNWH